MNLRADLSTHRMNTAGIIQLHMGDHAAGLQNRSRSLDEVNTTGLKHSQRHHHLHHLNPDRQTDGQTTEADCTVGPSNSNSASAGLTSISAYVSPAQTWPPSSTRYCRSLPAEGDLSTVGSFSFSKTHVLLPTVMR